jgi:capsule polysaccharide export protein KpsE/RkpR
MMQIEDSIVSATAASLDTKDEAWVINALLLWANRRLLAHMTLWAFALSTIIAFVLPKQYESTTRIMPPGQATSGVAMLAALAGKGSPAGGLASLASGLLGGHNNGALFLSLLRSGTVSGHLIERFQLQHVYHKRYMLDTAKKLARKTTVTEDNKSGVITIVVEDGDPQRARDMTQAYLDELNALVSRVNTSSAHLERTFIEQRLQTVQKDLQQAQIEMSEFAARNTAIDIKEQTRAMVEVGAKLQGQLIASQSELDSLKQIYGSQNVRVRAAEARVADMRLELQRASGASDPESRPQQDDDEHPYPALRQLPGLAVPWANIYRKVRIQETVYELLSAQYETARIEEAKSIPTVSVIDPPGLPEKKSSPHRSIIILVSTALTMLATSLYLLARRTWLAIDEIDGRRVLARAVSSELASWMTRLDRRRQ